MIERGLESRAAGGYDHAMSTAARRRMTYADLVKLPPDLNRHEILEGEWYMTPAPSVDHQLVVGNLHALLRQHVLDHDLGMVLLAPADVLLSSTNVLEPDLLFVSKERLSIVRANNLKGAPDLAIEVSSPSTAATDRGRKLEIYRKRGVREYWIVDLFARVVEIHEFGRPPRTRIHEEEQTFETARLPGLKVRVDDVFRTKRS